MLNRTFTASTLSLALALAAGMVGCANDNHSRAENNGSYAKATAHNRDCPVCGMKADSDHTVWYNGSAVNCCSQACCDRFNSAADNDKQMWVGRANRNMSSSENWRDESMSGEARVSNFPPRPNTTSDPIDPYNSTRHPNTSANGVTTNTTSYNPIDPYNNNRPANGANTTNANNNTSVNNSTNASYTYSDRNGLNRIDPITGKTASDKYIFVDADGTRIAFSSQEAADLYMSYGPEHRAEVRAAMRSR